jgi:hypothetical protein
VNIFEEPDPIFGVVIFGNNYFLFGSYPIGFVNAPKIFVYFLGSVFVSGFLVNIVWPPNGLLLNKSFEAGLV